MIWINLHSVLPDAGVELLEEVVALVGPDVDGLREDVLGMHRARALHSEDEVVADLAELHGVLENGT